MADEINFKVRTNDRQLPTPENQNVWGGARASRYGDQFSQPLPGARHALALEGTYFLFHNITNDAATTLAGHPAPVLADCDVTFVKALLMARMPTGATAFGQLDFIEIEVITAAATGTQSCWAAELDTGATRYSSGTVETLTQVNPNMQSSATGPLVITAGPIVVSAESANCRYLGHGTFRPSIEIAGDKYVFTFGREASTVPNATAAASVRTFIQDLGPVVLGPTDQFLLGLHSQASVNAAGVYKVRGGYWAR